MRQALKSSASTRATSRNLQGLELFALLLAQGDCWTALHLVIEPLYAGPCFWADWTVALGAFCSWSDLQEAPSVGGQERDAQLGVLNAPPEGEPAEQPLSQ